MTNFEREAYNKRTTQYDYLTSLVRPLLIHSALNFNTVRNLLVAELEQKRANLELSDSLTQSFLSNDPSKASPLNDLNNNKISSNIAELTNLTLINDQIISQLKANNPLSQIEFVSNYSAIQTSIRNTFGYIRINNQINAQQTKSESNFAIPNNQASIYDYLAKSQSHRSKPSQNELFIDLEPSIGHNQQFGNLPKGAFNLNSNNTLHNEIRDGFDNKFDYFGNPINTFSSSSTGSSKSNCSSANSYNQNNTIQRAEQKPIGSCYENNGTSPISISTDNLQVNSCLPSNSSNASSNYFLDQFSSNFYKAVFCSAFFM